MKILNLTTALLLLFSLGAFAQSTDSTKTVSKEKQYTVMGKSWKVVVFEDGSKSYEWEIDEEDYTNYHSEKSSKFDYNFLETEVGINIWPEDKGAPQVKPWGSWFVSLQSAGIWKASKNFHLRSTLGVSWYNFKFEDENIYALKTADGLEFVDYTEVIDDPNADPIKSKISASYATLTVIPTVLTSNRKMRFGAGAYAGFRLGGRGKFVYESEGEKEKDFTKSNMYVENFRYGLRSEIGIGDVTLFFNYDLNDLFQAGLGPELQAMSFGIRVN
ncbi:hypothetical protein GCM10009119_23950 [Algoriphagus jejuensis]|uniref:Outer membrane protein with beta-barrel domain n=1 Tax=Algoriphagus jejuensis TaxID=419934 RepID=A0ABN1N0P5_9BACT